MNYLPKIGKILLIACCLVFSAFAGEKNKAKTYPEFEDAKILLKGTDGKWDEKNTHTCSIVEANKDGYKYWAYYGVNRYCEAPSTRRAGLIRSNDLVNWEKYSDEAVIDNNCRWPTAVIANGTFYIFYAEYDEECSSQIVMVSSKDGIHFGDKKIIAPLEKGKQNQNPFIYFDKKTGKFNLFYYNGIERGDKSKQVWKICLKSAKDIEQIDKAKTKTLLSEKYTIAAPSICYFNNQYYLLIEAFNTEKWGEKWVTLAFSSSSIDKGYKPTANSLVLQDNDACAFQYVFNKQLYMTYSHCVDPKNNEWLLKIKKAK
ncbi:MAG: hypothetical protein P4L45_03485 [Ignavibacteriaceae bacterium]|nr:hypothetical protein [Ignavibacteriaceae bacterium]